MGGSINKKKEGIFALISLNKKMQDRIKLIWDFRGPNAAHIAQHHAIHLSEFAVSEGLEHYISSTEEITEMHHTAFLVVEKQWMDSLRKTLKPNRGQVHREDQV